MKAYVLTHSYEDDDHEDTKLLGVFTSRELATEASKKLVALPGFRDWPDGFSVGEYEVDRLGWAEGFGA